MLKWHPGLERIDMKIAVIGANGRLGSKIVKHALNRGHKVKSIIYSGDPTDSREEVVYKSVFDVTKEDLIDVDVVLSAYGSGFKADPVLNKQAYLKYKSLMEETGLKFVTIAGAGSLYSDDSHTLREYEQPDYYQKMYGISKNIYEGICELKKTSGLKWTAVCPSQLFDFEGPFTGNTIIGLDETILHNEANKSVVTYEDLASSMLDVAELGIFDEKVVTFATRKGY